MTAIVGILCKKGVVVGADSSATFASGQIRTIEQKTKKISIIEDKYIIAGTGQIGLGQRFVHELEKVVKNPHFASHPPVELCRVISEVCIKNFITTNVQQNQYGALFAFPFKKTTFNLCEFDPSTMQPELKTDSLWYVSMGSGQIITDPFLGFIRKIFWHDGKPSLQQGILTAIWTLQHAIELNPGGINEPIDIAILEEIEGEKGREYKARMLTEGEIEENKNHIKELENHIARFTTEKIDEIVQPGQTIPKLK